MNTTNTSAYKSESGMSLVELMIAMTIGMILIGGALVMYQRGKSTYQTNETIIQLQEKGRFALDFIESDLRLAGYWGLHNQSRSVEGGTGNFETSSTVLSTDSDVSGFCDSKDWILSVNNIVEAYDQAGGGDWYSACGAAPTDVSEVAGSDAIFVRHAGDGIIDTTDLDASGTFYVVSNESPRATIFTGTEIPPGYTTFAQNHRYVFGGYYVRDYTYTAGDNIPSLRRLSLTSGGANPQIANTEVIPGVENMQIRLGLDTFPYDDSVDRYVNPEDPVLAAGTALVRPLVIEIELLVRSEKLEAGLNEDIITFMDGSTFDPATADAGDTGRRRLVVKRTIYLRNS